MANNEVILLILRQHMFGVRPQIVAIHEKEVKYEYREEPMTHKSPLLLGDETPIHKKIPNLDSQWKPICESKGLQLSTLTKSGKTKPLCCLPILMTEHKLGSGLTTLTRSLRSYSLLHKLLPLPQMLKWVYDPSRKIWATKGEEQEAAKKEFIEILKVLEGALGEKSFFEDNFVCGYCSLGSTAGFMPMRLMATSA
ncbi:Glutathione S-transferase 5 [Datura stramonium]|uniref:Glutathione S-transferase n=1 Tax=Datura stramonium TaxID=4076 RepID=A0ABS8WJR3_DATST|nr:Glutathione S-transferase 5 [Datura stramonium]